MDRNEKNEATMAGAVAALKVLVAKALALATRNSNDPRGDLREVLSTIDESLSKTLPGVDQKASDTAMGSARETVISVGTLADLMLSAMGAPPASDQ